jgi:Uma2 family endonuclease
MDSLAEERRYTYKDYITWDDDIRYELIDGVAYAMAAPAQFHQEISGELFRQLANFLIVMPCKAFHAPFDARLNAHSFDDTVVQPDILVVCDHSKLNGKGVKGAPDFVIEILSPYTARRDAVIKFRQYQRAGVKEYWIVDPNNRTVQVYVLKGGKYGLGVVYREDDVVPVHTLDGCQISLAEVFYGAAEPEPEDIELMLKQKIIEAMKENGIDDKQIEKIIDSIDV